MFLVIDRNNKVRSFRKRIEKFGGELNVDGMIENDSSHVIF